MKSPYLFANCVEAEVGTAIYRHSWRLTKLGNNRLLTGWRELARQVIEEYKDGRGSRYEVSRNFGDLNVGGFVFALYCETGDGPNSVLRQWWSDWVEDDDNHTLDLLIEKYLAAGPKNLNERGPRALGIRHAESGEPNHVETYDVMWWPHKLELDDY